MARGQFFKTAWVFFLAAGVIVLCSAALYFLMDVVLVPRDAYAAYREPQEEQVLAIAHNAPEENADGAAEEPELPEQVLPQYTLIMLHPPGINNIFEEDAAAYDAMYTPEGAIPVSQAAGIAVRYVMLLAGGDMENAECTIHVGEYVDHTDEYAEEGAEPAWMCWYASIATADGGDRFVVWLDAYSGQLRVLDRVAAQDPGAAWTADGVSRDVLTQYEFSRAVKECLVLAKGLMQDYILEGRQIYDARGAPFNAFEHRAVINGGNLIAYNFHLDDGSRYHVAFSVKSEQIPELAVIDADSSLVAKRWDTDIAMEASGAENA